MTSVEEIEEKIKGLLQRKVVFALESKILKKGRLILFCVKDFFCVFTLICEEKNNKRIIYELPYPFKFLKNDDKYIFDYTVKTFCHSNPSIEDIVNDVIPVKPSKLFNKKITITTV
jgi:hypothetical protein